MTVLALAVTLDLLAGDPPNRWHPVAWIGALIARGRRLAPRAPDDLALYGTFLILVVTGVAAAGAPTSWTLPRSPPPRSSRSPRTSPTAWWRRSASMPRGRCWVGPARASRSPGPTA